MYFLPILLLWTSFLEPFASTCVTDSTTNPLLNQLNGSRTSPMVHVCNLPKQHGGRSVMANQDIAADTVLLSIPLRFTLNRLTAQQPPLQLQYPTRPNPTTSDPTSVGSTSSIETMASLFLLHVKHVHQSTQHGIWDHYVASLPTSSLLRAMSSTVTTPPLYWTKRQLQASQMSGVGQLVQQLRTKAKATWHELFHPKHGVLIQNDQGRIASQAFGTVKQKDFEWALSMVLSRSFKIPVPWDKHNNLRHVMVPGADLINYARNANTFLRVQGKDLQSAWLEVVAIKKIKNGEQVTSTYGQLNAPCVHTLVHYGFCDASKDEDGVGNDRGRAVVQNTREGGRGNLVLVGSVGQKRDIGSGEERGLLENALSKIAAAGDAGSVVERSCGVVAGAVAYEANICEIAKTVQQERETLERLLGTGSRSTFKIDL